MREGGRNFLISPAKRNETSVISVRFFVRIDIAARETVSRAAGHQDRVNDRGNKVSKG